MYYRGANSTDNSISFHQLFINTAAVLVYDITSEDSFENVKDWVKGNYDQRIEVVTLFYCIPELKSNVKNELGKPTEDQLITLKL